MNEKANERQLNIIFLLIIGTFTLILLSFAYLSNSLSLRYLETDTKMISHELARILNEKATSTSSSDKDTELAKYFEDQSSEYTDEGFSLWLLDSSGDIVAEAPGNAIEFKSSFLNSVKEPDKLFFDANTGGNSLFFADKTIYIARIFSNGSYSLILENDGSKERQIQRMQYVVIFSIGVILLVTLLVLISNMFSRYKNRLLQLATTDELTGLANRKYFTAEFNRRMALNSDESGKYSMFLLDIDLFKQINDKYGHSAGDAALSMLAAYIKTMVSKANGFAGRWGGDEFIGVINLPSAEAKALLFELCRNIQQDSPKKETPFTISVGITSVQSGMTLSHVCENADLALYESKKNGRNTVSVFSDALAKAEKDISVIAKVNTNQQQNLTETMSLDIDTTLKAEPQETRLSLKEVLRERFLPGIIFAVKWMTPFVAAGGILIASAFLFDAASFDLSKLSVDERASLGSMTSISTYMKYLGDTTFNFMLPVFSAFMAYSLAGESAFMAGLVGGYMVIDTNSGFIGAAIAGLAAGIISREINLFTDRLPKFIRGAAPIVIYPIFSLTIVQAIAIFMIRPTTVVLGSVFNTILDNAKLISKPLTCTIAAGMMSVDMGGIINKIAYNYGLASIDARDTMIMAAVMAGGMVPPIGIAISIMLFRDKFCTDEKNSGIMALFMGLSFITEGALPFVITDFIRVIPSCIVGSAVSGLMSSLFGCKLPAPHGGIFVLPVVEHPLLYLLSILTGSMVTAIILGFLKKKEDT